MPRIIAIEVDPARQQALTALVRDHVKASLAVVPTVRAAIASMAERTPDLVTMPTWLPPQDEAELLAHMKDLDGAPFIQMLTVPVLELLTAASPDLRRRGVFDRIFNRRAASIGAHYDPTLVAEQIVDALARARELRLEYAATLALEETMSRRAVRDTSLTLARCFKRQAVMPPASRADHCSGDRPHEERRVALRMGHGDVPWLSGITLWGAELKLINISSTGVLVETGSKLAPGTTTNIELCGPETNLVVPVRFIRSDVARVDGLGVRYRAAAAFAKELDIDGRRAALHRDGRAGATPSEELAALFGAVMSSTRDEPAHTRFAQGLRQLLGARDVRVSSALPEGSAGRETLYFDLPGNDRSRTALQVMFDRNHAVTDVEFRMLKAAACLTAAVLELEKPAATYAGPKGLIAGGRA